MSERPSRRDAESRLPDQAKRDAIESHLGVNMLVEAGAGSGKTESLARRMAAGILDGTYAVEGMAAVTFTRKAAAELRGRFQQVLEGHLATEQDPVRRGRAHDALSRLERFFAGTIHSFCAHLLRERPVEADLAPGFTELDDIGGIEALQHYWREFLAVKRAEGSPVLLELTEAGIKPGDLDDAFRKVCTYEEVGFPAGDAEAPDAAAAWQAVDQFWARLEPLVPYHIPDDTTCKVLKAAREFRWKLPIARRERPAELAALVSPWVGDFRITMIRWSEWHDDTKKLRADIDDMLAPLRAIITPFVTQWRQYVYRLTLTLIVEARAFARDARRKALTLSYDDLLQIAARVLRERPDVRAALQQKYRWLFVDEFQDTDPIQAEVVVWLASEKYVARGFSRADRGPTDWATVSLRPGSLFIVGDPKQSIYRFRRADIETYAKLGEIIERSGGEVVPLETNFRSVPELCHWANRVFEGAFPAQATPEQPGFHRLVPLPKTVAPTATAGVRVVTTPATATRVAEVVAHDASSIARYIRSEIDAGRRKPEDFLVLTWKRGHLPTYAAALEELGVPIEVSGAGAFGESEQVRILAALLRALSDPDDEVEVVGVLRGPLFGISDAALYEHREQGGTFVFTRRNLRDTNNPDVRNANNTELRSANNTTEVRSAKASAERSSSSEPDTPNTPVATALATLDNLHRLTRTLPSPAAVDRILEQTGYLALAAASSAGGADAGDLLHALDRVRRVTEEGGTLADAADALDTDLESNEVESLPLEPGRTDVVRVMNLHKAKGLEADVVFLADPCGGWDKKPDVRIVRDGDRATGYLLVGVRDRYGGFKRVLGEPAAWSDHATAEQVFVDAEQERLRYVAATRARQLLVVSRWAKNGTARRPWLPFEPMLGDALELEVPDETAAPEPVEVDLSESARTKAQLDRERRLASAQALSFTVDSVTGGDRGPVVVREDDSAKLLRGPATGMEWGELVHKLLEHAARNFHRDTSNTRTAPDTRTTPDTRNGPDTRTTLDTRNAPDTRTAPNTPDVRSAKASAERSPEGTRDTLTRVARSLTQDNAKLESVIPEALDTVERVMQSEVWQRAMQSDQCHAEVPFTVLRDDGARRPTVQHGAIDLVFRDGDAWTIIDYKTDQLTSEDGAELIDRHRDQLAAYATAWRQIVGSETDVKVGLHAVRAETTHWLEDPA